MIQNRVVALIYRSICFIVIFIGLLASLGVFQGAMSFKSLMYYTMQSNILALILFGILVVKTISGLRNNGKSGSSGYFPRFELVCVIDLLLTLIVYWVMLAPQSFSMGFDSGMWAFPNLSVHLFAPLMCLVDYILFTESDHLKYSDVYLVLIYPLFYVASSSIAGLMGYVYRISGIDGRAVRFPYFFIDFDEVGALVIVYIIALVIFFLILSHLFYLFDKKVKKPKLLG